MTATTTPRSQAPGSRWADDPHRAGLLAAMVDRAGLELHVPYDQAVRALCLTFGRHGVGSKTAALVGKALTAHRDPAYERPPEQRAVRRLISRGQPAYQAAIAAELERMHAAEVARPARRAATAQRLRPIADRDGPHAAELVAEHWRRHDCAPSPVRLARLLGWRTRDAWPICALLVEAGWLEVSGGTLRPTPGPVVRGGPS